MSGEGGTSDIASDDGTLQLNAVVTPANANNKNITWQVLDGTGKASINNSGLVTAIANGTVIAKAIATDGSGVYGDLMLVLSNQYVSVSRISLISPDGNSITTRGGRLQLEAEIDPSYATIKAVSWSIVGGDGQVSLSPTGMVTAYADGTVTIKVTSKERMDVYDTINIKIMNQMIPTLLDEIKQPEDYTVLTSGKLVIYPDAFDFKADICALYSIQGVLMHKEKITGNIVEIDISSYPAGIYIVSLSKGHHVVPFKILISN